MDFLSGVSLKDHLRAKGPLSFERCVAILTDLAAAVEYTHFGGLVHRDIKPENVFLDPKTGQALLTDFGIACAIGAPVTDLEDSTHGTPSYMSPEHIEGRPLDARSDIYSMGCVAYEMLTGTPPWAGMTIGEVLERQRRDRLPPVHLVRRDIPAWLEGVVAQAVAKDPNGRFPDAKSFSEALAHNVTVQSQVAVNPRPRQLIGAAVSIVGAVALFLAGQSGSSTTAGPDLTPRETFVQSTLLPQSASRGRLPSLESGAEPSRPRPEAAAQELRPRAEPAAQFLPEPEVFPDNGFAEGLLAQAARLDGQPEGFGLIGDLEGLSRNSQVSQPLRAQARAQAVKFRRQCEALQALGAATCP
jgi:serine/threonine protein kinase